MCVPLASSGASKEIPTKTNEMPSTNIIALRALNTCQNFQTFCLEHHRKEDIAKILFLMKCTYIKQEIHSQFWSVMLSFLNWIDNQGLYWLIGSWSTTAEGLYSKYYTHVHKHTNLVFLKINKSSANREEGPCNLEHWYNQYRIK